MNQYRNGYTVEVRGEFGGAVGDWRPAITGTLNQTGFTDEAASTFDNSDAAHAAMDLVIDSGAEPDNVRVRAI